MYVQGGIGAIGAGERFGENYELPNATAYNETCAAIANVYWNHRMFLLHGDSKYIDILEKSLYNGLISGVGMDGNSFFYTNAMEIKDIFQHKDMEAGRSGWFTCSCCPTNVTRLIPSIPGYVYAQKNNDVYVNLFVSSNTTLTVNRNIVQLQQQNNYPWDGKLTFRIDSKSPINFSLKVRIPGWAQNKAMPSDLYAFTATTDKHVEIKINGKAVDFPVTQGYAVLNKTWRKGDVVEVDLPMEVKKIVANKKILDDLNKVALQRGPIIYCAEWPDNDGKTSNIVLPVAADFKTEFNATLHHGITVLQSEAFALKVSPPGDNVSTVKQSFTAIPYYSWAHRGKGEMAIWFPTKVTAVEIISK